MNADSTLTDFLSLTDWAEQARPRIEDALKQELPLSHSNPFFNQALHDAVFPGGRRMRASLALLACELVGGDQKNGLTAAVTVEYLHASAVVLDDLPAMDNARERRGRPCLHVRYGEGLAVVAALALLNASYEAVVSSPACDTRSRSLACCELTERIGAMIAGQATDLTPLSNWSVSERARNESVRHCKTSALIQLAATLGPLFSGAEGKQVAALSYFGRLMGEAYQNLDDSHDIDEDTATSERGRAATFAIEHGLISAKQKAADLLDEAQRHLIANFDDLPSVARLCEFAKAAVC